MRSFWCILTGGVAAAALLSANPTSLAEERIARSGEVKIELPEAPPPVVTDGSGGLGVRLALPQGPPTEIVIDLKEPAGLSAAKPKTEAQPEPKVEVAAPDLPPTEVVIRPDAAPETAKIPDQKEPDAPKPAEPVVAVVSPPAAIPEPVVPAPVIPAPAAPAPAAPEPEKPTETKPVETPKPAIMPSDALRTAVQRLKSANRITDVEVAEALTFYEARNFAPLWQEGNGWNTAAKSIRERLSLAREDGLDPARYRSVSAFVQPGEPNWTALAAAEVQLTESVILYAREASTGRIKPGAVHAFITPVLKPASAGAVLKQVSEASDAGAALQAFNPRHAGYQALRKALKDLRDKQESIAAGDPIPDGPPLRVGMRDPRVPLIRARLGLGYEASPIYDRGISIKLASLQRSNNLPANGIFTPATARVLSGERPTLEEAELIANMERWRWLPRELGKDHIWVNAPEQRIEMIRGGSVIHTATAIIGTVETQTPVFSDEMDHIVVNPSWFVPPGILKKEPKYLDDAWAEARGYTIRRRGENATVRVPPGPSNPLGYVKFMFPNDHAVYLHDTPKRGLFNAKVRTLSNGCVRVQNPFLLAARIFEEAGWTEEKFKRLIGGGEQRMNLPRKLPIHLTYFTMTVDESGALQKHPDFYGHSARLRQLLGLS